MKISIITVCYNSQNTIRQTLNSIVNQENNGYDLEYIIIDGMSTDNTLKIIDEYRNIVSVLISEKDSGIYNAMNKGLDVATGDIVGFLNSDDYYTENNVISQICHAFNMYDSSVVYGDINYVKDEQIIRKWTSGYPQKFSQGWHPPHPGFYVRREFFQLYGGFDEVMTLAADFDLMLRFLIRAGDSVAYIPKPLVNMNTGGASNSSFKNILRGNKEILRAFRKNNITPGNCYTLRRWINKLKQF